MLTKEMLEKLYLIERRSSQEIAILMKCSVHKIDYWLNKYKIPKRNISEAVYLKHNPSGDPFSVKKISNIKVAVLFGLGLGLYWGEGNKKNQSSIRLGNTDPRLIKKFIEFLIACYRIKKEKLRFSLQIFSDISPRAALGFWTKQLRIKPFQFTKIIITPARGIGTYKEKSQNGVLTVHFHNKKLRDIICGVIETL